ncbi:MAG TPA: pyrroline-5-carboxylate reductase [Anaerolineae bacterium]|nr:pyrroline-5-carboxylate reductase [Anaerolineae bacterium]
MLSGVRISFVGSGIMAEAMIKGLLREGMVAPDQIVAGGPRAERGQELFDRYGVHTTTHNVEAVREADLVVLSVKPQVLCGVLRELAGHVVPDALLLSIVAGAHMSTIERALDVASIVRVMPNTPAQIGMGISVWTATEATSQGQRAQALAILGALGEEVYVDDEGYLDMATALSGTGPAYVFLLMEAMVDAGVHLGFSRHVSERLVIETLRGSVEYARQSPRHLAALRNQVTSPGGTSAEALYHLEKGGLRTVLSRAIWAAYQRSRTLGSQAQEKGGDGC